MERTARQKFLWLVFLSWIFSCLARKEDIEEIEVKTIPSGSVARPINSDLIFTCKVNAKKRYNITWTVPGGLEQKLDRFQPDIDPAFNISTLKVHRLHDEDAGTYTCHVHGHGINIEEEVELKLFHRPVGPRTCLDNEFLCPKGSNSAKGYCIHRNFVCDGYFDCPDGYDDEASELCGPDPCENKIPCEKRCIPREDCCDPAVETECVIIKHLSCCKEYLANRAADHGRVSVPPLPPHQRYNNVELFQSSLYTVVSCTVAFAFIATIMVAAVCRIHMRRSVMSLYPPLPVAQTRPSLVPWQQMRPQQSEACHSCCDATSQPTCLQLQPFGCSHGNYVVAYTPRGSDKIHFFQHFPDPPSYSQAVCLNDLPPPYASTEQLEQNSSHDQNQGESSPDTSQEAPVPPVAGEVGPTESTEAPPVPSALSVCSEVVPGCPPLNQHVCCANIGCTMHPNPCNASSHHCGAWQHLWSVPRHSQDRLHRIQSSYGERSNEEESSSLLQSSSDMPHTLPRITEHGDDAEASDPLFPLDSSATERSSSR